MIVNAIIALLALIALAVGGCATASGVGLLSSGFSDVKAFARADVAQALTMASAATDAGAQYRARCYATLLKAIPDTAAAAPAPDVKGLVSGFERAFELAEKVKGHSSAGLVSEAVQADCGYLKDEIRRFVVSGAAKAFPGGSLIGDIAR